MNKEIMDEKCATKLAHTKKMRDETWRDEKCIYEKSADEKIHTIKMPDEKMRHEKTSWNQKRKLKVKRIFTSVQIGCFPEKLH